MPPVRRKGPRSALPPARRYADLHITLRGVEPPVWRRLLMPTDVTLVEAHVALQVCLGWEDRYAWAFETPEGRVGEAEPDSPDAALAPPGDRLLAPLLPAEGATLVYTYDSRDRWTHDIRLTGYRQVRDELQLLPMCLAGARACPPEESGGPAGYRDLLEGLADPAHPEHEMMRLFAGEDFDPEAFSARQVNRELVIAFTVPALAEEAATPPPP